MVNFALTHWRHAPTNRTTVRNRTRLRPRHAHILCRRPQHHQGRRDRSALASRATRIPGSARNEAQAHRCQRNVFAAKGSRIIPKQRKTLPPCQGRGRVIFERPKSNFGHRETYILSPRQRPRPLVVGFKELFTARCKCLRVLFYRLFSHTGCASI